MRMAINIKKTVFVSFTSYSNNLPSYKNKTIRHNGKTLNLAVAYKTKYLGVIVDELFEMYVAKFTYIQSILAKLLLLRFLACVMVYSAGVALLSII